MTKNSTVSEESVNLKPEKELKPYYVKISVEQLTITPGQAAKWTSDLQQLQQELTQLENSSNEKSQSYRDLLSRYNQMSEIVSKLQNKLEIAEQNSKNLTESLTGKTQQLTSLISEKQQTEKLLDEANKLLTAYSESCKKKLAIIKRQRNAAYVVAAAALIYSIIKK